MMLHTRGLLACTVVSAVWAVATRPASADTFELEVLAGDRARVDTPVTWEVPERFGELRGLVLYRVDEGGERRVGVQSLPGDGRRVAWIVDGRVGPGQARRYRLVVGAERAPALPEPRIACADDGATLSFSRAGDPIATYRYGVVAQPDGVDDSYARSGYLHPLWTPAGRRVTNDFPENHLHHHGVWFPWSQTTFEGRRVNFWESGREEGRVEFVRLDERSGGEVLGYLRARQRFVDLSAPEGPKVALDETWEALVWAVPGRFVVDLTSVQSCASDAPLLLREHRYGGLGLRGAGSWEGPGEACRFLTSEGLTDRVEAHATRARWCDVRGAVDGELAGVTVMCHPENFRFPQAMRVHPSEPFFNFTPCQLGDFEIRPGKPYTSRYRFVLFDGPPDAEVLERLWTDYAAPPEVRVVAD